MCTTNSYFLSSHWANVKVLSQSCGFQVGDGVPRCARAAGGAAAMGGAGGRRRARGSSAGGTMGTAAGGGGGRWAHLPTT